MVNKPIYPSSRKAKLCSPVLLGIDKVHKKQIEDELGGYGGWEGTFRVRKRWYEDKHTRRHTDEAQEKEEAEKALHRERHSVSRGYREVG